MCDVSGWWERQLLLMSLLRWGLHKARQAVYYWLRGVWKNIEVHYSWIQVFPHKDGDTFYKCLGLSGWKVKSLKKHLNVSGILVSKFFYFFSVGEMETDGQGKLYSLRRGEIASAKFSFDSKFISESPPDLPRVDGWSLLRVQHVSAEI